jgi:hypothetical protein
MALEERFAEARFSRRVDPGRHHKVSQPNLVYAARRPRGTASGGSGTAVEVEPVADVSSSATVKLT